MNFSNKSLWFAGLAGAVLVLALLGFWVTSTPNETTIDVVEEHSSVQQSGSEDVSVPGMSTYVSDFGYSFWYPSTWTVQERAALYAPRWGGTVPVEVILSGGAHTITISEFISTGSSIELGGGACGGCQKITYFFDAGTETWMQEYPMGINGAPDMSEEELQKTKVPAPVAIQKRTMGGLPMFNPGDVRFGSTVIPLSANRYLYIAAESDGAFNLEEPLAKTVVSTDSAVATPWSEAQQIQAIQAAKDAYSGQ
jgi:hypothetical protein